MKKIADIESPFRVSFRVLLPTDLKDGAAVHIGGDSGVLLTNYQLGNRIGTVREMVSRSIYRDIGAYTHGDGCPSREEMARVWAESLIGQGQGSMLLIRAMADVLRECAAEGDEWALEALAAFSPSQEAAAA